MHLVLAASATACGGAIAADLTIEEEQQDPREEKDPTKNEGFPRSPGTEPSRDPYPRDRGPIDAGPPDSGQEQTCRTGLLDFTPDLCCAIPGDPDCMGLPGGEGSCQLDCRLVCAKTGGGLPDPMQWCNYYPDETKVSYACGACGVGRIPDVVELVSRGAFVAERLAMQAYYEAASVIAFARLARVLTDEGAPRSLVRRVKRAAADERRHARLFERLARRRGARVPPVSAGEGSETLFELALENAREGQVRETYGALVALHQSRHAIDPELRAAFASIAGDEIAHAALSWDLARFFESRLSAEQRALVAAERTRAMRFLRVAATGDYDATDERLGMPAPEKGRAMFDELFSRVA